MPKEKSYKVIFELIVFSINYITEAESESIFCIKIIYGSRKVN